MSSRRTIPADAAAKAARRRSWPRPGITVATIALLTAVIVWILTAWGIAQGDLTSGLPGGVPGFIGLTAASSILDLGAAWLVLRDRARGPLLGYLVVRTVLAMVGLVLFAFPSYAIATAALFGSRLAPAPTTLPHAFQPPDQTTPAAIALVSRLLSERDLRRLSRSALDVVPCEVCGQPEDAPIHQVDDADVA